MNAECREFRSALEAELLGRPSQQKLVGLSWHAHLLSCGECRDLLEKEEALEALLASLPEPRLPEALARRVLVRLQEDRAVEVRLDNLLDLDSKGAPEGLAADILARLAPERAARAARLDALLDLDREVEVPAGLPARVLRGLERHRRASADPSAARWSRAWKYAAAAGVLVAGLVLYRSSRRTEPPPDPKMLAAIDVLEQWDLLMQDDVDVLLSTLGPADEALLDYR